MADKLVQGSKSVPFPILLFPPANLSACLDKAKTRVGCTKETSLAVMQNQPDATLARMEKDRTVTVGWGEHLQEGSQIVVTRDRRSQINFLLQECESSAYRAMAVPSGALRWHCPPRKGVFMSNQDVRQISTWTPASPEMQASKECDNGARSAATATASH